VSNIEPYPGLRPFQSDEDFLFFGREEQISELLHLLQQHRFLAVVGSSGSGKSSLVRCGLMSQLHGGMMLDAGASWTVAVMQPGGDPLTRLAQSLIDAEVYSDEQDDTLYQIMATINRSSQGLVEAIKQSGLSGEQNVLLVVDQFEEIFRFHEAGKKGKQLAPDFIRWIIEAVNQSEVPIYVVLTMRSDFLGDCARFTGLAEAINQGEYLVPKLSRDQLQKAIEGPARVAGGEVSRRLIQRLLNDVGEQADQLPVLQHSLMRSWESCKSRADAAGLVMDLEDYEAVGGMRDALSSHADEVLRELRNEMSDQCDIVELIGRVFKALTEKGMDNRGIRRPTRLDVLSEITAAPKDQVAVVVEAYRRPGRTFLMPFSDVELTDDVVIDISHESLMRVWTRLKEWVEQESQSVRIYKRLSETALLWAEEKASLYRNPDLQIALSWMEVTQPNDSWATRINSDYSVACEFLTASDQQSHLVERLEEANRQRELRQARELAESQEKLAQEQAASARKFRRQFQISGVIALVAVLASVVAIYFMYVAKKNESIANDATQEAIRAGEQLTASYRKESVESAKDAFEQGDLSAALSLLEVGYKRDNADLGFLQLAMDYISQTDLSRLSSRTELEQTAKQYVQSTKHNCLGYVTQDNVLHVMEDASQEPGFREIGRITVVEEVSNLFVDDSSIRVVEQNGRFTCFDRVRQEIVPVVGQSEDSVPTLKANSSNHVSVVGKRSLLVNGSTVNLVEHAKDNRVVASFEIPEDSQITHVQLSEDGNTAFLVSETQGYLIYNLADTAMPKRQVAKDSPVLYLDYLPLQNKFLTLESSGLMVLTGVEGTHQDSIHAVSLDGVEKAGVSPEGTRLAVLDAAGFLSVFSLIDGRRMPISRQLADVPINDFAFDPMGLFLVVVNENNQLSTCVLSGSESKLQTLPVQVAPESVAVSWASASDDSDQKLLKVHFVERTTGLDNPAMCSLEIRRTIAAPGFSKPSWTDLELTDVESSDVLNLFAYFSQVGKLTLPSVDPPSHPSLAPFMRWVNRYDQPLALQSETDSSGAGRDRIDGEVKLSEDITPMQANELLDLALRRQLTAASLARGMVVQPAANAAEVTTRYHLIKYLQRQFGVPQTPEFCVAILQHIAALPNLLEIRSQSYEDQIHEGQPVNLTGPKLIDQWDGMSHWWDLKSPNISLKENRDWLATDNQYAIWRGGHFSDYRLQFELVTLIGNSGIDGRSVVVDDLNDVFQAEFLHPYLHKGYQADLVGSQAMQAGNFHGKVINDNYRQTRPLILADRGETVVVGSDARPIKLARSSSEGSIDLLKQMSEFEKPVVVTMELRGNQIAFRYGDLVLSQIFDSQDDRAMSGEVAIQAMKVNAQLTFRDFSLIPLGRDIAEAEVAQSNELKLPAEVEARLMASRKQWYALDPFLDAQFDEAWVAELRREMNLERRQLHRRLAKAMIANQTKLVQEIIDEIDSPELLAKIAASQVGDSGFGSVFGTPVLSGAVHGSTDSLRLLATHGVPMYRRVLAAACFGNQPETVEFLLDNGCNPDAVDFRGFTILHEAAKWSGPEVVKLLLEAGADINIRSGQGLGPLEVLAETSENAFQFGDTIYAKYAMSDRRLAVAQILIDAGSDPASADADGRTAIEVATKLDDTELIEVFTQAK
jgi:hypothetical protein